MISLKTIAIVGFVKVNDGSFWHNAIGVYLRLAHIVMTLNMIQIARCFDARILINIFQVIPQIWEIDNALQIAFEMPVIYRIKPQQGCEQTHVSFGELIAA